MLPEPKHNIYPKSDENIIALIDYYFSKYSIDCEGALEKLKENTISLNQLEYVLEKLAKAIDPIFRKNLSTIVLINLIQYGMDALIIGECESGSTNRKRITKEFRDFVVNNHHND